MPRGPASPLQDLAPVRPGPVAGPSQLLLPVAWRFPAQSLCLFVFPAPASPPALPLEPKSADAEIAALTVQLAPQELTLRNVDRDGNCLFRLWQCCVPCHHDLWPDYSFVHRAMSDQLHGNTEAHAALRKTACDYMLQCPIVFRPAISGKLEAYVARMRRDGEWGDQAALHGLGRECAALSGGRRPCVRG